MRMSHMRMRHIALALPVLTVGIALALGPTPAQAETPAGTPVLVSADGSDFSSTLSTGLFDFAGPLIPGGSAAATLFVRNPTDRPMVLTLEATDVTFSNQEFADALSVIVTSAGSTAAPVAVGTADACASLLADSRLLAHATTKIDLALAMADVTGSVAQGQSAAFDVRVSLRDAAAAPPTDACGGSGVDVPGLSSPGSDPARSAETQTASAQRGLAHTGSDAWPPLLLGTGLLGAGLALFAAKRRKRRT